MDYSPHSATACERKYVGQLISFTSPPPLLLRNTLVARTVESAAPFLAATVQQGGKVNYEIVGLNREDLMLFANIETSKMHIGTRENLSKAVSEICADSQRCRWQETEHECFSCKQTLTTKGLFFCQSQYKSGSESYHYRLCYSQCPNPECRKSQLPVSIPTLIHCNSKKTTYAPSALELSLIHISEPTRPR